MRCTDSGAHNTVKKLIFPECESIISATFYDTLEVCFNIWECVCVCDCVYMCMFVFVCVFVSERCRTTIKPQSEHMVAPFTAADLVVTTTAIFCSIKYSF